MENLTQDRKLSETSKQDHISEIESVKKNEIKKKIEKIRKDDGNRDEDDNSDLVAIGRSNCGRWVKFRHALGEGGYKTVFKGYDSEKGKNVAWCEFKPQHVDTKEKQVNMMKEIEIMVKLDHPNIVTCYDIFDEYIDLRNPNNPINVKSIILIQELLGEGTLKSVIKKNFIDGHLILEFSLVLYWLHQIIDALAYMHEKLNPPIIHRDLKADNCFLESKSSDKYLNVKVGDFGLATQVTCNKEKHTMLGTVGFMAPEVYDEKYDVKVDIYAFGMLMLEVITNRTPYDDCETVMQVAKHTMSGKLPDIFSLVSDPWTREVISCCIHPLPTYRPTAMELFYHPIFLQSYELESKNILPVEITPNSDKCFDREKVLNDFIENMVIDSTTYNTKFNLRMEFRNKRIQKSFDLDEGESLEFDLDVFKQEDIPELISNLLSATKTVLQIRNQTRLKKTSTILRFKSNKLSLTKKNDFHSIVSKLQSIFQKLFQHFRRWPIFENLLLRKSEYEEKLTEELSSNKNLDIKSVNIQLEKFFKSMELQMNFLMKMILGKRWYFILESLLSKHNELELRDDITGFSLLANYKKNWVKATKQLENEIYQYQTLEKNVDSVKISRICRNSDIEKLDSLSFILEKNAGVEMLNSQIGNIDVISESPPIQKIKDNSECYNYNLPSCDNITPNQPVAYQYNCVPFMNPVVYPNELSSFGWQMYNAGKINPVPNFNKLQDNSASAAEYKPHNKVPSISKTSTKTKVNSMSEKPNRKSKNKYEEENYINKIFTLDEIMKYIISKSHRNSKNPFIIIPVKGQSNAFYLLKINDSKLMDGKTDDSVTNKDDEQLSSKLNSITNKATVNQMPYNNPHENLSVKSNSAINCQNEMFMLPPIHPSSSSNFSLDNVANYTQYNLMNFWLQQQNLFQQQIFQHQQQQLLLQQQQIQYQQQLQRRLQLQQQHIAKKNNLQSKNSGSYDIYSMIPPANNEQSELADGKIEANNIHNESILSKFVVKKIEEPCMNTVQFSKTDSTSFSLEDDRLKHGSKVEHQKIKKVKDKTSKNKTMENHCNLDTFNDKLLNETLTNSQGEHDRNNFQQKMDREKSILFSRCHLESEINHQSHDRLKCNKDHSIINHSIDTNNTATSTSEIFKTTSKHSKRNCDKKNLEVSSNKVLCKTKDFNHSSTVDFTDSEN